MESFLHFLLVEHGSGRRDVRIRSQHLVRCGRHFFRISHHGWHPGPHQPKGRRPTGKSRSSVLPACVRGVRFERQQFLQLQQRKCRWRELHFLRRDHGRHGRGLHRPQLFPLGWFRWRAFHFQFVLCTGLWHHYRLGLCHRHRHDQRGQLGEQLAFVHNAA